MAGYAGSQFGSYMSRHASGGWEFSGPTGGYINRFTGERRSAMNFGGDFVSSIVDPSYYASYEWEQIGSTTGDLPNGELYVKPVYGWAASDPASNSGAIDAASSIVGGIGITGSGMILSDGTYRVRGGSNGILSPKYYASGWKGGSPARITTHSVAKLGSRISTGANAFTTGVAYYNIASGNQQPITYVDAGVGTAGLMSSIASYYAGVQIPYVGAAVAIYGTARLTFDVFYNLGYYYGPSKWFGSDNTRWFK